jgi:hypothetical protein
VPPDFVSAIQEALSGLEKISVSSEDIKKALLQGRLTGDAGRAAQAVREAFLNDRCKGKDASKLRFVVE